MIKNNLINLDSYLKFISLQIDNYGAFLKRIACSDLDGNYYNDIATIRSGGNNLPTNLNIKFNDGQGNFINNPITEIKIPKSEIKIPIICYPNPFSNKTIISININSDYISELKIYDIQGKLIRTLIDKKLRSGKYKFIWKGKDLNGKEVKTGIYLVRLQSGRKVYTQRIVLIK